MNPGNFEAAASIPACHEPTSAWWAGSAEKMAMADASWAISGPHSFGAG